MKNKIEYPSTKRIKVLFVKVTQMAAWFNVPYIRI
jgi:hypothetical protein